MSKYIIGGGIAGLIAAYYNKEYKIISQDIGGQMVSKNVGPRILEVNQYSKEFLNDLGIKECPIKIAKIGYKVEGKLVNSISEDLRKKYYIKSRCLHTAAIVPSSIMSDGKSFIEYFDIDWDKVVSILVNSIEKPINGKVSLIDTTNHILKVESDGSEILRYDSLVSTIPAPVFFKISNLQPEQELKYVQKVFVVMNEDQIDFGEFDYIYFPDSAHGYHRISKTGNGKASIEYTTNKSYKSIIQTWSMYSREHHVIPVGQIQSGKVQEINDILFLGRYASWDHDIKTDDIVKICRDGGLINAKR